MGDQGEGKASKDSCESFSSCCTQEADLKRLSTICTAPSWKPYYCGNPTVEARMCSILRPLGHDSCTYSPGCFQSKVSKFLVVAGLLVVATAQILKRRKKK